MEKKLLSKKWIQSYSPWDGESQGGNNKSSTISNSISSIHIFIKYNCVSGSSNLSIIEYMVTLYIEHSTSTNARNAGMASCGISHIWRQGLLRRLWILRCPRYSVRRRREALLQGVLHWGLHRFYFWEWPLHVQSKILALAIPPFWPLITGE